MRIVSKLIRALLPPIFLIATLPQPIASIKSSNFISGIRASDVNFQQAILSVRFVYLDNQQNIVKIYNNAKLTDFQYLLKFFASSGQEMAVINQELLDQYLQILEVIDPFSEGFIFTQENQFVQQESLDKTFEIDLRHDNLGLKEIYTYI